jgi:transposase
MGLGMSESLGIDSPDRGWAMPQSYSADLRKRVVEAIEMGASRYEAADRFEVSVSSAVKWHQRWRKSGSTEPKPRGGSVSPLEKRAERVLAVIAEHPDLTLLETTAELRRQRIRTSKSALSRFFGRHNVTLKKKPAGRGAGASRRGAGSPTLDPGARHA